MWITLKTKTLSNGEFVEIHDAITSLNVVYEKLSDNSKTILQVLLLQKKSLSYGALDFYMDKEEVALREAINELSTIQ